MMGFSWGMSGFGWIIMILFWILIILGIVYILRKLNNNNSKNHNYNSGQDDSAVDAAQERYAKGEITKEELNEILDDLN